jgi:hypothetical protein
MNPFFPYHFQSFCPNSCALLPSMQVIYILVGKSFPKETLDHNFS